MGETTDNISPNAAPGGTDADVIVVTGQETIMTSGPDSGDVTITGASAGESTASTAEAAGDDRAALRDDIEQTRSQMGGTIDAIQERLSPQRLAGAARDAVRDATIGKAEQVANTMQDSIRGAGNTVVETIKDNPVPAALIGLGLGWLIAKGRATAPAGQREYAAYRYNMPSSRLTEGNQNYPRYQTYGAPYPPYASGQQPQTDQSGVRSSVQSAASSAQDKMGQVSDQVQSTASQVAGQVQDTASQLSSQAQVQARRAQGWFQRTLDENPLALGALALAAGALAGMLIPETQPENQFMGPTRDTLVQRAQGVAQDTVQRVQSVAQEAKNAAEQEAHHQGLTSGSQPVAEDNTQEPTAAV